MSDQETVRQAADHQRAVSSEIERAEDRDTGHTLIGFGVFIGAVAVVLWLAGVDVPGPVFGVAILATLVGLGHVAATRD